MPRRTWRVAGALAAPVVLLAGCSVGTQSRPVTLGAPPAVHEAHPGAGVETSTVVQAFFVHDGRLSPLVRLEPTGPGLTSCLAGLTTPLTAAESATGLSSALPTGVGRLTSHIRGTTAVVDIPTGFDRLNVTDQILAAAQVVFTVTANSYVSEVQMTRAGHPVELPDQTGLLVSRPVGRHDYAGLAPP